MSEKSRGGQPLTASVQDGDLLPWLEPLWDRLRLAWEADRLPHALLLAGARGLGKRRLADLLARALLCSRTGAQGLPCGTCADCGLTAAGTHPDLARVAPDPESKSGEITIDAIRDLSARAALTSVRAARKIVLIDPADRMNGPAANALLKTLEEPAGATLLVLIAERPGRLPATIRSRCQMLKVPVPPEGQALAWLTPRLGQAALTRLRLAAGAPLRALDELDQGNLDQRSALIGGLLGIGRGELDPVAVAAAWNGVGLSLSLEVLAGFLYDLLRLAVAAVPPRLTDPSLQGALGGLARGLDLAAGHRLLRRVLEARGLATTTLNPQLELESLLIDWGRLMRR